MSPTESIVEEAALSWLGEMGYPASGQKPSRRPSPTGRGSLTVMWYWSGVCVRRFTGNQALFRASFTRHAARGQ
jgi:hypothetical protein